jgi:DNA helicase-2/ATP-dependent DNA helicase PcrA
MDAPWLGLESGNPGTNRASGASSAAAPPKPQMDLLKDLNPGQAEACLHDEGPLLILAGPGSGKTRVITRRIAHLICERGVQPWEVLAITFTNKAAKEMRERVEAMLPGISGLWVSTFHSMCARILRREIEALEGYTRDFSIYDTSDRNALIKKLIKELNYDIQQFRPMVLGGWISNIKNGMAVEPGEFSLELGEGMEDEVFRKVWKRYEQAMRDNNALDFDDLLVKTLELFDQHPGIRDAYSRRFRYVMVDEYQDTNRVQYLLTRHLSGHYKNLAVCGDPDQSIYRWRGADVRNILDFEADHAGSKTVRLEQNYRSTATILKVASAVIGHNQERKQMDLFTEGEEGDPVVVLECADENEEATEIAAQCLGLKAHGRSYSDCAVFYRMNFMQRALEAGLRRAGVPYQVVAGLEFYARREIRDLIAYLRLIVNPADDVAFGRVVNAPLRGVGATSVERLTAWAADRRVPLSQACRSEEALSGIRGRGKKGLALFGGVLDGLEAARGASAADALAMVLDEIDVGRWIAEMDDGNNLVDREANVDELSASAEEFDRNHPKAGLAGFLENVALVSDSDAAAADGESVKLMTLHACKGLEFPAVFITGLEEELLPHSRALEEDPDGGEEEERRLFYVGMTRAKERLTLTHATTRNYFGSERWQGGSRFLDELPAEWVEGLDEDGADSDSTGGGLGAYEPAEGGIELQVGDRVEHDHFGVGRIENVRGAGINGRATVAFIHSGTKELLLAYANLKKVN